MYGKAKMRQNITTALEALGAIMISIGAFQIWQPIGWITAGGLLVGAGILAA